MRCYGNWLVISICIMIALLTLVSSSDAATTLSGCSMTASFRFESGKPAYLMAFTEFAGTLPLTAIVKDKNGQVVAKDQIELGEDSAGGKSSFKCLFYLTWTPKNDGPYTFALVEYKEFHESQRAQAFRTNGTLIKRD